MEGLLMPVASGNILTDIPLGLAQEQFIELFSA
jgi:hypothetical protein